ncbi:hypothetical protein QJS10_CPB17g00731 [Acorus calamus]|uniref:Uncharacterized protein n=1 Tax=Acorus calamus TaxID=4465 RepID=A0AAV9CYB5_ACOCL|nr:hypothetical protein QJS10_CPB17g00731 [Acorus calamus]
MILERGLSSPSSSVSLNGELLLEDDLCFTDEEAGGCDLDREAQRKVDSGDSPSQTKESAEKGKRVLDMEFDSEDSQVLETMGFWDSPGCHRALKVGMNFIEPSVKNRFRSGLTEAFPLGAAVEPSASAELE